MLRKQTGEPPDAAQAFRKAADYCASQERCLEETRIKMKQWGIDDAVIGSTLDKLTEEGFIDEQRFAAAFARGKFRMLRWGKIKISLELRLRKIPAGYVSKALNEIDPAEYSGILKLMIQKKIKSLGDVTPDTENKVMKYAIGKGFEPELVRSAIKECIRQTTGYPEH